MTDHDDTSPGDFRRRLDAAMAASPDLPTAADRVRHGRRALRRRRLTQGVAGVAAIAVIGSGATWAVGAATGDRTATDPAAPGSSADLCPVLPPMSAENAAALPDVEPSAKVRPFAANEPFAYDDSDGSFSYRPGLRGIEHLTGTQLREGHADTRWDAVEIEGTNGTWYGIASFTESADGNGGGGSSRWTRVDAGRPSLAQWASLQLEVRTDSDQDVLGVDDDGEVVAAEGVEILQQAEAPDLVDRFGRGETIRVAEVRRGTSTCFVVADTGNPRTTDGATSFYLVPPEYAGGTTLEELIATVSEVRESVF